MSDEYISLSLQPVKGRGRVLDRRMRRELANSLDYLKTKLRNDSADTNSGFRQQIPALDDLINLLRQDSKISSAVFGSYYALVFEMMNDSDGNTIREKLRQLLDSAHTVSNITVRNLSIDDIGNEERLLLYRKCFDTDPDVQYGFSSPSPDGSHTAKERINDAFELMKHSIPDLYDEITGILSEILLASTSGNESSAYFSGASSYQLWGAMVLNADMERSVIDMLGTLTHESTHNLLFGLTVSEPLVLNGSDKRYQSPLRADPRPMDGIFHATVVSARMYYAMQELFKSPVLSDIQKRECESNLGMLKKAFYDGFAVISAHAEFSDTGREIMQNAHQYMQEVATSGAAA